MKAIVIIHRIFMVLAIIAAIGAAAMAHGLWADMLGLTHFVGHIIDFVLLPISVFVAPFYYWNQPDVPHGRLLVLYVGGGGATLLAIGFGLLRERMSGGKNAQD